MTEEVSFAIQLCSFGVYGNEESVSAAGNGLEGINTWRDSPGCMEVGAKKLRFVAANAESLVILVLGTVREP